MKEEKNDDVEDGNDDEFKKEFEWGTKGIIEVLEASYHDGNRKKAVV